MFKRLFKNLTVILCLATILFLPISSVHADSNTDNFRFKSFTADYYLSKDKNNLSTMKVVEKLVPIFPEYDQNKGLVRKIPVVYDNHSLGYKFISLTRNDQTEPVYDQYNDGNYEVVETGTDDYLHDQQTYVLTYELTDVIKDFSDHQELYWDVNGTGWAQSFDNVTATLHLSSPLSDQLDKGYDCFEGETGSTTKCLFTKIDNQTYQFKSADILQDYSTLTFVIGFKSGTFKIIQSTTDLKAYISGILLTISFIGAVVLYLLNSRAGKGKGTIIPQYQPMAKTSLIFNSQFYGSSNRALPAQIIDLAVRKKIRIIESDKKKLFSDSKEYSLELLDTSDLNADELNFIDIIFESKKIGTKYTIKQNDQVRYLGINSLNKTVRKEIIKGGYRVSQPKIKAIIVCLTIVFAISAIIFINDPTVINYADVFKSAASIGVFLGIPILIGLIVNLPGNNRANGLEHLTSSGMLIVEYLKGLKLYIKYAEADRLNYLQSVKGADRQPIDTNNKEQMVKLYERLLPYAILFRQEKSWAKVLGNYYDQLGYTPSWYYGNTTFNSLAFINSINDFSNYQPYSSSSSSGLGGGGFAGGGGGGGGGGGR